MAGEIANVRPTALHSGCVFPHLKRRSLHRCRRRRGRGPPFARRFSVLFRRSLPAAAAAAAPAAGGSGGGLGLGAGGAGARASAATLPRNLEANAPL